jgi:hypothetical protein
MGKEISFFLLVRPQKRKERKKIESSPSNARRKEGKLRLHSKCQCDSWTVG